MKKIVLILTLSGSYAAFAQSISDPLPFSRTISAGDLKKHLYVIAGPGFEGRETATEGQERAASYIENEFRALGLKPGNGGSYRLNFPVFRDSLEQATMAVNGKALTMGKDFLINLRLNNNSDLARNDIVFAGYGISGGGQNDYQGLNVRGKIVLVLSGVASGADRLADHAGDVEKLEAAQRNGAVALLIIQPVFPENLRDLKGKISSVNQYNRTIYPPLYYVTKDVARMILGNRYAAAETGKPHDQAYPVDLRLGFKKSIQSLQSSEVLGLVEGTDLKDQVVIVSAHFDHLGRRGNTIFYGADDDGSGVAGMLAIARAFMSAKAAGKGPRRSILLLANSGEEKGLLGSQYYSEHPVYPLERTVVDLNIDMIGRIDRKRNHGDANNYVYVVGSDRLSTDLRPISEGCNKKYSKLELDYKYDAPADKERIFYRSDHYNFARKGVPILFYFDGINEDYHKPTDTPDKINYEILQKRARLIFFAAWEIANRNAMVKRDIPLKQAAE